MRPQERKTIEEMEQELDALWEANPRHRPLIVLCEMQLMTLKKLDEIGFLIQNTEEAIRRQHIDVRVDCPRAF